MKVQFFTFFFLVNILFSVNAQISQSKRGMSQGVHNSLAITLPNVDKNRVEDVWKDYMKEFKSKPKYERKDKEYFSDDAEIASLGGSNTVDVYSKIDERGSDVEFTVWFDLGGAWLSSSQHPSRYPEAEKFVLTFALDVARNVVKDELEEEEKELKQFESTLSKLKRDNDNYHKEIENAKERIAKAESNIEENLQVQEDMRKQIDKQIEQVNDVQRKLENLK